ncbi:hypothetical protein LCGC14_0404180 [marine sediment metagenome]|uniref:Uncharacterized protein n=1 Tax=marine sediment metagenome TaxID=412755 RepID=A0A0F9T1I8_9ZZZZ
MKFKVGQKVELVNNSGMAAPKGAIAIVKEIVGGYNSFLKVVWIGDVNYQMSGHYTTCKFKPLVVKNQQLLFSFMDK